MIHTLSIPTPFAVGRVNCYLIDDDPLTLVDTGPNSGKALDELDVALRAHGRRIDDLERIVITHQHLDHMGLVGILARRSQAEVVTLDLLAPVIEEFGAYAERDDETERGLIDTVGGAGTTDRLLAELAAGEPFEVLELAGGRAWGFAPGPRLAGYVDAGALGRANP